MAEKIVLINVSFLFFIIIFSIDVGEVPSAPDTTAMKLAATLQVKLLKH